MNSEYRVTYLDPENRLHEVLPVRRADPTGFYEFFSVTADRPVKVHCSAVVITKGDISVHGIPAFLDALLKRRPDQQPEWVEWRTNGPVLGKLVELRRQDGATKQETIHSTIQMDALMQQGYQEWRYI